MLCALVWVVLSLICPIPAQAGLFDFLKGGDGLPSPPDPPCLVNDFAKVLRSDFTDSLERALVAFDEHTSNQICVVTVKKLGDREIVEYGTALGNKWGIGSKRNNGVLVLLKSRGTGDENFVDVAILTGRGLEGAIPDAYAARIIRNIMGPHLRRNQYEPAIAKACAELMALAAGEISEPRDAGVNDGLSLEEWIVLAVLIVIFLVLIFAFRSGGDSGSDGGSGGSGGGSGRSRTSRRPFIFFPGGGFSGSSGGFGGSSGGFGGFGGGSFGGGGARGRF